MHMRIVPVRFHIDNFLESFDVVFRPAHDDAGAIDQHVQAVKAREERFDLGVTCYIKLHCRQVATGRDGLYFFLGQASHCHFITSLKHGIGDAPADAAGPARNDCLSQR